MKPHVPLSVLVLAAMSASAVELKTWDRYQCIVDRAPFGPIYNADDPQFQSGPPVVDNQPPVDEGPKLSDYVKVSAITVYNGVAATGFTDTSDGKSYYLYEGRSAGDYTVVKIKAETKSVILRKGEQEEELYQNAQVGAADGSAAPAPGASPAIAARPKTPPGRTPGYKDLQQRRAEEERRKQLQQAEAERRKQEEEELNKLTREEREKKLREYNLELIRTGGGPPLPIELNREELVKLGEDGFDVTEAIQALDEREASGGTESRAERIRRLREEHAAARAAAGGAAPPAP